MSLKQARFMDDPIGRIGDCQVALECFAITFPDDQTVVAYYRQEFADCINSLLEAQRVNIAELEFAETEEVPSAALAVRLCKAFAALRATMAQMQLLRAVNYPLFWELAIGGEASAAHYLVIRMQEAMSTINEAMEDAALEGALDIELPKAEAQTANLVIEALASETQLAELFAPLRQAAYSTDSAYYHVCVAICTVGPLIEDLTRAIAMISDNGVEQHLIDRGEAILGPVERLLLAANALTHWAVALAEACQNHGLHYDGLAEALRKLS